MTFAIYFFAILFMYSFGDLLLEVFRSVGSHVRRVPGTPIMVCAEDPWTYHEVDETPVSAADLETQYELIWENCGV